MKNYIAVAGFDSHHYQFSLSLYFGSLAHVYVCMVLENVVLTLCNMNICVLFLLLTTPDFSVMLPVFYLPSEDSQTGTIIFSCAPGDVTNQTEVISEFFIYMQNGFQWYLENK